MKTMYKENSSLSFYEKTSVGSNDIFTTLSGIRNTLTGTRPHEKLVHVVEKLQCRAYDNALAIRVSGSFIIGNHFLICGEGIQAEGVPHFEDLSIDLKRKRLGMFREQFIIEQGSSIGCFFISKQELYIKQN